MNRYLVLFVLLFLSLAGFCQDKETVKAINALIGPEFKMQEFTDVYHSLKTFNKTILLLDAVSNDTDEFSDKIYVFKKVNNKLQVIDSSARFELDGRGPHIEVSHDTLNLFHSYHHGGYNWYYKFDVLKQKFSLVEVSRYDIIVRAKNDVSLPIKIENQSSNISKQELMITWSNENDNYKHKSIQKIKRTRPTALIPDLAHFIDYMDDKSDVYDQIWKDN